MLKIIHSSCRRFSSGAAKKSLVKSEVIKVDEIGVGVITLSNPSHLNALTVEMGEEFKDHVKQMRDHARNQNIRACIVTGDGDAFSAGGDLNWLRERHSTSAYLNSLIMLDFYNRFLCIRDIHVPTIAAINGAAIGAGLCMTLACDIRVVSDSAKLGFTFPKLGIHPGMGASVLLPRIVRQEVASHLLMSGDVFSGSDAKDYGLVLKSVSKDDVMGTALNLALNYGKNSPIAVQTSMHTLRTQKFLGLEAGLTREADSQAHAYTSHDFIRGLDGVKAKKNAKFEGWE